MSHKGGSQTERANEGRKRLLTILHKLGGEEDSVVLLDMQRQYFLDYDAYLDKAELQKYFSKRHIKQVFEAYMLHDVEMSTDISQTGSLYLKLKRPLDEALSDCIKSNRLVSTLPTIIMPSEPKKRELRPLPPSRKDKFTLKEGEKRQQADAKVQQQAREEQQHLKKMAADLFDESEEDELAQKKRPVERAVAPVKKFYAGGGILTEDDEEGEEEVEGAEESEFEGDYALEAGNQHLLNEIRGSRLAEREEKDGHAHGLPEAKNPVKVRTASHADKYFLEVLKKREEQMAEEEEKRQQADRVRARLESQRQERQRKEQQERQIEQALLGRMGGSGRSAGKKIENLLSSEDEEEDGEGEEYPMELVVGGGRQQAEKEGKEKASGKSDNTPSPEEMHDAVDEDFYKEMKGAGEQPTAGARGEQLGEADPPAELATEDVFLLTAVISAQLVIGGTVLLSQLHAQLLQPFLKKQPFAGNIGTAADLLAFVQKNCKGVEVMQSPDDAAIFLRETDRENVKRLLKKVGKSIMKT